ncbi:MAG: gliding motility-associated C-terminal domain-containing protein [Saprospiraceae bacterium]|nr:gliding motility-associated C-terminal domain-containing protein [Saprospiraceae bacterium]
MRSENWIVLLVMLLISTTGALGQCANAGNDTLVCGYRFGLIGEPAGGTWTYLCSDSTRWLELGGTSPNGRALAFASECGTYSFIYTVSDTSCMDADTVQVSYEDPGEQSRRIQYDIDIQYGNHSCPGLPIDSCGHIQVIPGASPPNPRWFISLTGMCQSDYPDPVVSAIDSSSCMATINYVGVNAMDTVQTLWTSTQEPFLEVDKQAGEIINNRFDEFLSIIEGSLMNGLDSTCREFEKCFVRSGNCVDTVFDTIPVIIPVHLGGQWGLVDSSGTRMLNDTTDFSRGGRDYRIIVATGARNFGSGDLQFELYERDARNRTIDLDTTLELIIFWSEDWTYDTTERLIPRLVQTGNCIDCGSLGVMYDTLVFPEIPTTFCPTIQLYFNPPVEVEIFGDTVICEDDFVILSATPGFEEYSWSNGTTSPVNFITEPDSFLLTVTDSDGCTATNTVIVIESEPVNYQLLYDSTEWCENNCSEFDISGSGILSYEWSNGTEDTTAIYCFSEEDDEVTIEITDTLGCRYDDTIPLTILQTTFISAGPDMLITCNQPEVTLMPDSAQLVNAGYFLWEGPGINPGNANRIFPTVDVEGTYVLLNGDDAFGCLAADTVRVRLFDDKPEINVSGDQLINCQNLEVSFSGNLVDAGNNDIFYWEGPGINAGNRTNRRITTDMPGEYIFFGCNEITGCCNMDTVIVELNKNRPIADAGEDRFLTCDSNVVVLGGNNSTVGVDFVFIWEGPGIDATNEREQFPSVRIPGVYTFRVTDTISKCVTEDMVTVINRGNIPIASAGGDLLLTCDSPTARLTKAGSSVGSGIGFEWEGPGITAQNRMSSFPVVDEPGNYILHVIDSVGNCRAADTVTVIDEIRFPDVTAGADKNIDCNTRDVILAAEINNDNGRMVASWEGPGINAGNRNRIRPSVDREGIYIITVIDTLNGCESSDTVEVTGELNPPQVDAGNDGTIDCDNPEVNLNAVLTGFDSTFNDFIWAGPDIIAQRRNQLNQMVSKPGQYIATIRATNENCEVSDTVIVEIDTIKPVMDAGDIAIIGCTGDTVILTADSDTQLRGVQWFTTDGQIIGSAEGTEIVAGSIGTYYVQGTAENGCIGIDSVVVEEFGGIDFFINDNSIQPACEDLNNGEASVGIRGQNLPYTISVDGQPFTTDLTITGLSPGNHTLVIMDGDGCTGSLEFFIPALEGFDRIRDDSTVTIDLCDQVDPVVMIGDNLGYGENFIYWRDDMTAPIEREVEDTGRYELVFENRCDTASIFYKITSNVLPVEQDSIFQMPNAFTPNGDGKNDVFGPDFMIDVDAFDFDQYSFIVYNRWGNIVFESTTPGEKWDGNTDGEDAPSEVYLFRLFIGEIMDCTGNMVPIEPQVGDVTLIR